MKTTRSMAYGIIISGFALLAGAGIAAAASIPASGLSTLPDFAAETLSAEQVEHQPYNFRRKYRQQDRYDRRRHGYRYRHRRPGYRFYFDGWWYSDRWWPSPVPRRYYGNRHVEWCLNRYRSYNPNTDRFLGYDGRYHRCRSPYRY